VRRERSTVIATAASSLVLATLGIAQPNAAPRQTPPVTLDAVLTKATAYVETFVQRFSNVVTEEHYKQAVRRPGGAGSVAPSSQPGAAGDPIVIPERREFRSDLIITQDKTAFGWIMIRDVFEVDGKPVRDRQERLTRLLTQSGSDARAQAIRIADESARYNIGPGIRTTNTPELSILFLQASLRPRFTFTLGSRERSAGERVWIVNFREQARPTLVRGEKDADMPATGRFWIDVDTGRVVKTDLNFRLPAGRWTLTTDYVADERLGIGVPGEMREYYQVWATETTGTATYGRFRTFGINVDERVRE
jgi:hypothetical protein